MEIHGEHHACIKVHTRINERGDALEYKFGKVSMKQPLSEFHVSRLTSLNSSPFVYINCQFSIRNIDGMTNLKSKSKLITKIASH